MLLTVGFRWVVVDGKTTSTRDSDQQNTWVYNPRRIREGEYNRHPGQTLFSLGFTLLSEVVPLENVS